MSKEKTMKVYAARDKNTGKFVGNITSRSKKFWERKNACLEAVSKHNRYSWKKYDLEVVQVIDEDNKMINSEEFNGMDASAAFDAIVEKLGKESIRNRSS